MGVIDTDGWVNSYDNTGIFKNCTKDCIIYTDANYSFDYNTQQATGTKPANWLDKFNNHYANGGVKGLTIIGNTPSDNFFQQTQPTDSNGLSTYVVKYRELDNYQEQIISGKSILKCYISQDQNLTFDNVKTAIQQNQVTEVPYTDVLKAYYQGSGKLNLNFKIQEYISKYKPKMIMLDVEDVDTNTKTINAFYMQQVGVDNPTIPDNLPIIENPTDNDFQDVIGDSNGNGGTSGGGSGIGSGNGTNPGVPNYGNDQAGNTQVTNDTFDDLGAYIIEKDGDVFITNGQKHIKITPDNYYNLLGWLQRIHPTKVDFYAKDILMSSMFSSAKYALAGHEMQYKIGYILYDNFKVNNFSLNFRGGTPIMLYKKNGTNSDTINEAFARKSYQLYTSLLEKWKQYYNKTEEDFKTLYNQSSFDFFEIDYSKTLPDIKRTSINSLFPQWNYINGPTYRENKSILINRLQNTYGMNLWFM